MIAKAYFFPGYKATSTRKPVWNTIVEAVTTAPDCTLDNLHALHVLGDFLASEDKTTIEMLAIDLVQPAASRVKIYFRSQATDFPSVARIMTCNVQYRDIACSRGAKSLRGLWKLLFDHNDEGPLPEVAHRTAGVLYYADFRLGDNAPNIKIYIPLRHYASSDASILNGLTTYLERDGHSQFIDQYRCILDSIL
jgi:DMATS type aromatic prenyltransferase